MGKDGPPVAICALQPKFVMPGIVAARILPNEPKTPCGAGAGGFWRAAS
jgi:hypothetical protein